MFFPDFDKWQAMENCLDLYSTSRDGRGPTHYGQVFTFHYATSIVYGQMGQFKPVFSDGLEIHGEDILLIEGQRVIGVTPITVYLVGTQVTCA